MARPIDKETSYRVKIHKNGGYMYASTQPIVLVSGSYIKHIWKTPSLKKQFCSFSEILDEMRPIRCIDHKGRARHITPFVGKQIDIAKAFGFDIPEGCDASYKSRKSRDKKVGCPAKPKVISEPKE